MSAIAFYAPMKPPDDPVPSGDRTVALALMAALESSALGGVDLISRLRSRDGVGDADAQARIAEAAEAEIARLSKRQPPRLWVTYHSYYKAPDLLGPALTKRWRIPYVLIEATRARKRLTGPYATFAAAAENACDAADLIFYFTDHDREALERDRATDQALVLLRPFLNVETLDALPERPAHAGIRLLACGMFRSGDKLASYGALAAALGLVKTDEWSLRIAGDGPVRNEVSTLFAEFGSRVTFLGSLDQSRLYDEYRAADLLTWPGVGEAFGMVYLEAQAQGCPVLAEGRPGVRDVVRDGGWLVEPGNPKAFAAMIDHLAADQPERIEKGAAACALVAAEHLLGSARATLTEALTPLLTGATR